MEQILSWLGWATSALVLVGVLVAGWEHLVREATASERHHRALQAQHPDVAHEPVAVDVSLDTQAAALHGEAPTESAASLQARAESEREARVSVMTRMLSRAAQGGLPLPDSNVWMDTTPRVIDLQEPALRDRADSGDGQAGHGRGQHTSQGS